jgi:predicted Fe-Mo cluster-binding NifX family protein
MNICIPITRDADLQSPVSGHFGSAPLFAIVASGTRAFRAVPNPDRDHRQGGCQPMVAQGLRT